MISNNKTPLKRGKYEKIEDDKLTSVIKINTKKRKVNEANMKGIMSRANKDDTALQLSIGNTDQDLHSIPLDTNQHEFEMDPDDTVVYSKDKSIYIHLSKEKDNILITIDQEKDKEKHIIINKDKITYKYNDVMIVQDNDKITTQVGKEVEITKEKDKITTQVGDNVIQELKKDEVVTQVGAKSKAILKKNKIFLKLGDSSLTLEKGKVTLKGVELNLDFKKVSTSANAVEQTGIEIGKNAKYEYDKTSKILDLAKVTSAGPGVIVAGLGTVNYEPAKTGPAT